MTSKPYSDDRGPDRARKVPAQRRPASVPTYRGAAEHLPLHDKITLDATAGDSGRYRLSKGGRYPRHTYFALDELAYLRSLIDRIIPPVTVTRVEDRQGGAR